MNGGSCVDGIVSYSCSCSTGYEGDQCQIGKTLILIACIASRPRAVLDFHYTSLIFIFISYMIVHVYSSFQISTSVHLAHV